MAITKAMRDAFKAGFQNPGAPLTPGERQVLRGARTVGPRLVFLDDLAQPEPSGPVQIGELSHSPCADDDADIIDAEIV